MDIAVIVDISREDLVKFQPSIVGIMSDLMIKYGLLVSFIEIPNHDFIKYGNTLPFYANISREGVPIGA